MNSPLRLFAHYGLAPVVLSLFGCEACPFILGVGRATMTLIFAVAFALALCARTLLLPRLVLRQPPAEQARRQARLDLGLFLAVAAVVGGFNTAQLGFPGGSGVKLALGGLTLGLLAATDLGLARQRALLREALAGRLVLPPMPRRATVGGKLAGFSLALVLLLTVDLATLLLNDLGGMEDGATALDGVAMVSELATVMAVGMAHGVNLILSWAANLRLLLKAETEVLEQVSRGRLDARVRVSSDDELGQIASHTNQMIRGLQEREQMRELLGKRVSPALARELLDDPDRATRLGGERREVVVMFVDLRGFTTLTERTAPARVVALLNRYLTAAVEVVHGQDGIVDKFLGDGVMAVFPGERAADRAVEAALALEARVVGLGEGLTLGVGLHRGEVVAGNVGSEDRLEYTHVGDAVNTAARIEGLCKELGLPLLASEAVIGALPAARREGWRDLGAHSLRGRRGEVRLYGREGSAAYQTR